MSDELYLDLIENAIYSWIKLAFHINVGQEMTKEHLCLLYTDTVDGIEKCCLLYVEPEYPPFDKADVNISSKNNFEKTKFLWKALSLKIKHFTCSVVQTMEKDDMEFFNNIGIAEECMCMNFSFYPLNKDIMMDKLQDRYPNPLAIEETRKTKKDLFQWYIKKIPRLAIKIEVLDNVPPPGTHTDLLSNHLA